jgi:hypothetical protein
MISRDQVEQFKNESWGDIPERRAAIAGLPPLYLAGFEPSISAGRLTVSAGEASVDGNRLSTEETLITEEHYVVPRLGSTGYYLYLGKYGAFFVDIIAPRVDDDTRVLSHRFRDGRYILYFELNSDREVSIAHKALPSELAAGDLANATARDQLAIQLGYTDYATMVTQVASDGSIITAGGYLRADLIEASSIIAGMIATDAITADKILAGAVGQTKLSADALAFPTEGLVAYYSFDDGSAIDTSGNGNSGTITGALAVDGKSRKALLFDGIDDKVDAGVIADLFAGPGVGWSLSIWESVTYGKFFDNGNLSIKKESDSSYTVVIRGEVNLISNVGSGWHHWMINWDGTDATARIDGQLIQNEVAISTLIDDMGEEITDDAGGSIDPALTAWEVS